jgi:D-amino-acid dehydrogenase
MIGPTTSPRVHIAGGHGMWGIVFGALTGKLLSDQITGRPTSAWATHLHPLR